MFYKQKLLCFIIILFTFCLHSEEKYSFILVLEFYSAPVANKEWEISIFKMKNQPYIQTKNYLGKTYKRKMDIKDFNKLLHIISKNNLLHIKQNEVPYGYSFFKLYYDDTYIKKLFILNASKPAFHDNFKLLLIIRSVRNFTVLYDPEY